MLVSRGFVVHFAKLLPADVPMIKSLVTANNKFKHKNRYMNRSLLFSLKSLTIIILLLTGFRVVGGETDPLHKRTFNVKFLEIKDGTPAKKSVMDEMLFKNGKLYSDFLYDKYAYKWIKYRINKDSIFLDSTDTEVRLLEVEATATDEGNQTVLISFSVLEWNIDGDVKITKNDKLKKYYEIAGREKGGKPKKEKKKKKTDENAEAESADRKDPPPGEQK